MTRIEANRLMMRNNAAFTDVFIGEDWALAEADSLSEECCRRAPGVVFFLGTRGAVLVSLGKPAEAVPYLERATERHIVARSKAHTAAWLAAAHAMLGHRDEAERHLAMARGLDPRCQSLPKAEAALAVLEARVGGAVDGSAGAGDEDAAPAGT